MELSAPIASNRFVEDELERLETIAPEHGSRPSPLPQLNALFHAVLEEQTR